MNSLMVLMSMGVCLMWMTSLVEYQAYQRLTTDVLVRSTVDEYLREGLYTYAQAYYHKHKKSLALPALILVGEPLARPEEQKGVLLEKEGEMLIMRISVKGASWEKRIRVKE